MNPFWEFLVNNLPLWIAPNLITILGFLFMTITYIITIYNIIYNISCSKFEVFLILFANFFYQTMDAIDGK